MYIPEFVCGVFVGAFATLVVIVVASLMYSNKQKRK